MKTTKKRIARISIGITFVIAGTGKLLLPLAGGAVPTFPTVLETMGIPLPELLAPFICGIEITGGLALIRNRYLKPASLLLASILLGALATFSIPSTFGSPLIVQGLELGTEFFRIPLELGLLAALVWINRRDNPRPNPTLAP